MARASQYSRGRQLVLQVVLVIILAGTLGLAAMISRSRNRESAIELTAKPHWAGRLAIRVPKGWGLAQDTDELPLTVVARESKGRTTIGGRSIEVYQSNSSAVSPREALVHYLNKSEGDFGAVQPFDFLGQAGVCIRGTVLEGIPGDPLGRSVEIPAWFAATVVPDAGPNGGSLSVVLGVRGLSVAGPAGMHVIRQLAEALSLRPEKTSSTLPSE